MPGSIPTWRPPGPKIGYSGVWTRVSPSRRAAYVFSRAGWLTMESAWGGARVLMRQG
jgi:hypothetical protein